MLRICRTGRSEIVMHLDFEGLQNLIHVMGSATSEEGTVPALIDKAIASRSPNVLSQGVLTFKRVEMLPVPTLEQTANGLLWTFDNEFADEALSRLLACEREKTFSPAEFTVVSVPQRKDTYELYVRFLKGNVDGKAARKTLGRPRGRRGKTLSSIDLDKAEPVALCAEVFPDFEFRRFIADYADLDGNGVLSPEELSCVRVLNVSDGAIANLAGIECFFMLEELYCECNNLTHLDLLGNQKLDRLNCSFNMLEHLDLSKCSQLSVANCSFNQLKSVCLPKDVPINCVNVAGNKDAIVHVI